MYVFFCWEWCNIVYTYTIASYFIKGLYLGLHFATKDLEKSVFRLDKNRFVSFFNWLATDVFRVVVFPTAKATTKTDSNNTFNFHIAKINS